MALVLQQAPTARRGGTHARVFRQIPPQQCGAGVTACAQLDTVPV